MNGRSHLKVTFLIAVKVYCVVLLIVWIRHSRVCVVCDLFNLPGFDEWNISSPRNTRRSRTQGSRGAHALTIPVPKQKISNQVLKCGSVSQEIYRLERSTKND